MNARRGQSGWQDFLREHGVNLVVMEPEFYRGLTETLRHDPEWEVILDEYGDLAKPDLFTRLFIALRRKPILPQQ